MPYRITQYNEPILRQKGEPVTTFDGELKVFARGMIEAMRDAEGIGLAAQQVGVARQFCVVDVRGSGNDYQCVLDGKPQPPELLMPLYLANPVISRKGPETSFYEEGCLSIPDVRAEVERPDLITVKYQDLNGRERILECDGILARCIQHELDHLEGILFIDHLDKATLFGLEKRLKRLRRQTRDYLRNA